MGTIETVRLGDLIQSRGGEIKTGPFGTKLKASEYSKEGAPLISVREIQLGSLSIGADTPRVSTEVISRMPEYLLKTGDIVVARKGGVDRSAWISEAESGFFLGSDGLRIRVPDDVDSRFFAFQLQSPQSRSWLMQHSTGSTMPSLSGKVLALFPVSLPPLPEQRRIAEILGALDDKIELNRKMNQTLEEMAQAIFKSWFIDFDGQTEFVDSELGRIPKGWSAIPFANAGKWLSGGTPSKNNSSYWGGNLPWFSAKSLGPIWLSHSDDTVTEVGAANGTRKVPRRTVLFIVRGMSLAKEWRIGLTTKEATLNQDLKAIVDDGTTVPELLLLWLLVHRELIRAKADEAGHGTKRLPTEVLHSHSLALPSREEQERMASPLLALLARIEVNLKESQTLSQLRDTLLPKLISGELRVLEAVESVA